MTDEEIKTIFVAAGFKLHDGDLKPYVYLAARALIAKALECKKLGVMKHPCETEPGELEHDWEFVDDSFDHEHGTEIIHYWRCAFCSKERDMESADYHEEDQSG